MANKPQILKERYWTKLSLGGYLSTINNIEYFPKNLKIDRTRLENSIYYSIYYINNQL